MTETIKTINDFEQQKQKFGKMLKEITESHITTENINNFANTALNKLIELNDEITSSYKNISTERSSGKRLEDLAYDFYQINRIDDLLTTIQQKYQQIEELKLFIFNETKMDPRVFVPASQKDMFQTAKGDTTWERKKNIPRLIMLLYLLENDFGIPKENVKLTEGVTLNTQMRKEPYFRIEIDDLQKLIYICIEEGNVTYIFDQKELKQLGVQTETLDEKSKKERRKMLTKNPQMGTKINQSKYWRERMTKLLSSEDLNYLENNPEKELKPIFDLQKQEPVPKISTDKNDEWYGFYTDENGEHWGTSDALCAKLKIGNNTYKKLIRKYKDKLKTKLVATTKNVRFNLHSLQNMQEICDLQKYIEYERTNTEDDDEWENFFDDGQGGHWASISTIAKKLRENPNTITNNILNKNKTTSPYSFASKKILDSRNSEITAYKYEDIENADFIKEKEGIPQVAKIDNEKLNQFANFYTDEQGNLWGTASAIAKKLETNWSTLKNAIKKHNIKPIDIIDAYGHLQKNGGYPLKEIEKIFRR